MTNEQLIADALGAGFEKSLGDIGYYVFMPRDENKWHELPYGAGGK
jgi:hypothetical protein